MADVNLDQEIPLQDLRDEPVGGPPGNYANANIEHYVNTPNYVNTGDGVRQRNSVKRSQSNDIEDTQAILDQLPSRQLSSAVSAIAASKTWRKKSRKHRPTYATVRHRTSMHFDDDPDGVVQALVKDADEEDRPVTSAEIRDIHTNLSRKKTVKEKVSTAEKRKVRKPSWFKRTKYRFSLAWKNTKNRLADVTYSIELWKGHLKKIEGNFGTGVTSYFLFLRWLLYLNIPVFLLSFSLVVLPQLLHRYVDSKPPYYNATFRAEDILTGGGWFNQTELYYGAYEDGIITIVKNLPYDMRYAYLLTCAGFYLLTVLLLGYSITKSYKNNYIESSGAGDFKYVQKVFCGWDYAVLAPKSAELKSKSIFKELQEYLSQFKEDEEERTCSQVCGVFFFRILTNLLIMFMLGGSGYLLWYISATQSLNTQIPVLGDLALALCVSSINFLLPFCFSIIASYEKYKSPRTELYITMLRTILLSCTSLAVLVYFWFIGVSCRNRDPTDIEDLDQEIECRPCWENFIGEQIYRLVIVDFVFLLVITFFSEFIRRIMGQYCCKKMGYPEFNIARNTLNLIYSQALIWLGAFYSPLLIVIIIFKIIVMFYVKRISVMQNCVPSVKPWRAGRTETVILGLLFIMYLLCFVAVAYSVISNAPSTECGLYTNYTRVYDVISEGFEQWEDQAWLKFILQFMLSTGAVAFILLALIVMVYYSKVTSQGHKEMVHLLTNQIAIEGKDKMFLLKLLQEANKGAISESSRPAYAKKPPGGGGDNDGSEGISNLPMSPGGKQNFAKLTAEHQQHEMGQKRKMSQNVNHPNQQNPAGSTQSIPNQVKRDTNRPSALQLQPEPGPSPKLEDPRQAMNPGFSDRSPTHKPNLPFPGSQYQPPRSGSNPEQPV